MNPENIAMTEFKCFDCDQVFLLPRGNRAKYCPKCNSERIQDGGVLHLQVLPDAPPES